MVSLSIRAAVVLALVVVAGPGHAQEKSLTLTAPPALSETGFLRYVLPRFSLKTSVRILMTEDPGKADVIVSADPSQTDSRPLITDTRDGTTFYVGASAVGSEYGAQFLAWLASETGQRTLASHRLNDTQIYALAEVEVEEVAAFVPTGDLALGEELSLDRCGRCHVINARNKANGIGSAPSFAALKAMADWDYRFQVFYTLNPHPSFTQIDGITDPFDPARPSPIHPITLDQDEMEAVLAYVASMTPLDLGAQIELK